MERVPKAEFVHVQQPAQQPLQVINAQQQPAAQMPTTKEEEKMPLFLIKLWNIVEDPSYQDIIRWDESGYSFHIVDPYSFCRNVLPHYFKHNNLNSLIRQLNMYGFRKVSPLDKGGLTRSESDQDHLEFSHTCFIRGRPDLMVNIKRRQSNRTVDNTTMAVQTHNNLQVVMEELRQLREKQRSMDNKMHELTKENEALWEQLDHVRQQHTRQQQVVTKLVQFLVAMVQPNLSKRVLKRGVLAIDEPPNKRARSAAAGSASSTNLTEILDRLQRELYDNGGVQQQQQNYTKEDRGPIIADVTDEFGQFVPSPTSRGVPGHYSETPSPSTVESHKQPTQMYGNYAPPSQQQQQQYVQQRVQPQRTTYQPRTSVVSSPPDKQMMQQVIPNNNFARPGSSNQMAPASYTPTLSLTPNLERQISQELQDYINGVDVNIDSCRDLLSGQWDLDFLDNLADESSPKEGTGVQPAPYQPQLALEQAPQQHYGGNLLMPTPDVGASVDVLSHPVEEVFNGNADPGTPQLLTPGTSPTYP